jgi:hypothetical protein
VAGFIRKVAAMNSDIHADADECIPLLPWLAAYGLTLFDLAEIERRFGVTLPIKVEVTGTGISASIWRRGTWETAMFAEMCALLPHQRDALPTSATGDATAEAHSP